MSILVFVIVAANPTMIKETSTRDTLQSTSREQFFMSLFGYFVYNGLTELARALAEEANFPPNYFLSLPYLNDWWNLMWPVYQEVLINRNLNAIFSNSFKGQLSVMPNPLNINSFKHPVSIRDNFLYAHMEESKLNLQK